MRVLILTQYFEPEPIPKPMELAEGLLARGHEVCVLTGFPNYPSGKLYPGYPLRWLRKESVRGVRVLRVPLYPSHDKSAIRRILNYGSFMLSAVLGSLWAPPCDVIYVWHPPLTIGVSSWAIGLIKRAPVVYDLQDIWPESGVWAGMFAQDSWLVRVLRLLERFVYRGPARILVVTEGARKNLIGKGVAAQKLLIASHWIEESHFLNVEPSRAADIRARHGFLDRFVVLYAGNLGIVQGLHTALESAELLKDRADLLFVLVGGGSDRERLEGIAREKNLRNVLFIGHQPMSEIGNFMAASDALLLPLSYCEICEYAIPVKTFAYLAAGKPILAALKGAAADLVQKAGAGLLIAPDDPKALARGVLDVQGMSGQERERMGQSGRAYLLKHHAKQRVLDEYVRWLQDAAAA